MGKNDFLTPKAIGNRIKAKGLTKLRFYCEMCQKACRDENGFKCHLLSDSHKRQMEVFGQNPDRIVDGYSEEFEASFMELMHPRTRIAAQKVYNELIQDRHHIHMNATRWYTLTEFVKYLGREGLCRVEDTSKGWFISLIHRDEEQETAEEARARRLKKEAEVEARARRELEAQVARARQAESSGAGGGAARGGTGAGAASGGAAEPSAAADAPPRQEFVREPDAAPLKLTLAPAAGAKERDSRGGGSKRPAGAFAAEDNVADDTFADGSRAKKSKVVEIMQREMAGRASALAGQAAEDGAARHENWLVPGIVVKVMAKALNDAGYYKAKGAVVAVHDKFVADVEIGDTGDIVRVDQEELETVIPKPGGAVKVVNGAHRGAVGTVEELLVEAYKARIKLANGVSFLADYEDVCKIRA